jgi:hypothetical protein
MTTDSTYLEGDILIPLSQSVDKNANQENESHGLFKQIESSNHLEAGNLYAIGSMTEENVFYVAYGRAFPNNYIVIKGLRYQRPLYVFSGVIQQNVP